MASLWTKIRENDKLHIAWCASGVVGCLMVYGVLQEKIMQHPFGTGDEAEVFRFSLFLVLCNRLLSCGIAVGVLLADGRYSELKPVAPVYAYAAVAFSNVVATTCQYEALKYVSFPVATLGKCAKMFPVMVWGILIMRKKYGVKDFAIAAAVTGGCTMFIMTGDVKSKQSESLFESSIYGLLLMLGYLGFDGFTSTFQDKMFKGYQMTTYNQILYTTLFATLISTVGLVSSGQFFLALSFVARHPDALWAVMILSASAAIAALFISYTIKTFGALVFATIMTTRQLLSILLSCMMFRHPLTLGQWSATVIVFSTLYYQGLQKKEKHGHKETKEPSKEGTVDDEESLLKQPLIEHTTKLPSFTKGDPLPIR